MMAFIRPAPESPVTPRLSAWIDALRWIAASVVFFSHLHALLFQNNDHVIHAGFVTRTYYLVTGLGHQAVVVFFVLSGYLVGGEVVRGLAAGQFSWKSYLLRRITRLYSVYFLALILGVVFDYIGMAAAAPEGLYTGGLPFAELNYAVSDRLDLKTFAGNLVFLQTIAVPTLGSNGPLWSLANEAWYYLMFPLLAWAWAARWSPLLSRAGAMIMAFICMVITRVEILPWFTVWLLGLVPVFLRIRIPVPLSLGLFLITVLTIRLGKIPTLSLWTEDMILGSALTVLLLSLTSAPPASRAVPFAKLHRWLAGFSYSLYLMHWPLLLLSAGLLHRFGWECIRQPFSWSKLPLVVALSLGTYSACWLVAWATEFRTPALRRWLATASLRPAK